MKRRIIWICIPLLAIGLAIFLFLVFSGRVILPQGFALGPVYIHCYGIIMATAVLAAAWLAIKRSPKYKIEEAQAENILFWTITGGFLGARFYHVLSDFAYYSHHPIDIFKIWNGGLSIFGALLGGAVALVLARKILNLKSKILNLLDWLAPSLLLGQIIGRFGNLFNYEAFGHPTNLPWKMFVPAQFRPDAYWDYAYFQPWFLYEALGNALILLIALKWNRNRGEGGLFFFYLLSYNILRFCLEFIRIDSTFLHGFRLNSIVSAVLALVSAVYLLKLKKVKTNG